MNLHGNQRGGWRDLGLHLLKDENDHVNVHEVSGFVSQDVLGALKESYAVSRGTRARQHMFSLSMNPPPSEKVATSVFLEAIPKIEEKLDLVGQPRVIVFHEKKGRRHAHVVWSRIDAAAMKAIQLSHYKRKLTDLSRELYLENNWKMPQGYTRSELRDPRNFTLAQWQQAKRHEKNPKDIKAAFQDSWAISDSQAAFKAALDERGYILAMGRKKLVALDLKGEVYAIAKWVGIKEREVRSKITNPENLVSVDQAKVDLLQIVDKRLSSLGKVEQERIEQRIADIALERKRVVESQQSARKVLKERHQMRRLRETKEWQSELRTGFQGLIQRISGRRRKLLFRKQREMYLSHERDREEVDNQIFTHLEELSTLDARTERLRSYGQSRDRTLRQDRTDLRKTLESRATNTEKARNRRRRRGPTREL